MMTSNALQPSSRWLARPAQFAAIVAFCAAVCPAIATAEPVWDIEEYDYCMKQTTDGVPSSDPVAQFEESVRYCCNRSGGVHNGLTCTAPPAKAEQTVLPPPRAGLPTLQVRPPLVAPPPKPMPPPMVPVLPPSAG
ncbi:hypothetical protein [Mycobacterium sp. IDR2000157661]|uniref:hypothetical protein n=1 Tax=Mycobacterium sp. IDR2000157661 TaxID=2867005 RepID=UPI001EEA6686|nr:hypothetical protein [Mycobacterium sp. IDR2000157661]ULE33514.1 hypothetical protein K3G64_02015 [Mycobacterium sp. IDR2000157661]